MNDSTQTLRDNYYESLLYMDIKEFKEKLPEFRYATFEVIIYGLMKKINERNEAKINKDYELADSIRNSLASEGIILVDTREGTTYKLEDI